MSRWKRVRQLRRATCAYCSMRVPDPAGLVESHMDGVTVEEPCWQPHGWRAIWRALR